MAYIEGQSLDPKLRDVPLPNAEAANYIEQVARAVHYAHESHILHRDLKPQNILVDAKGRAYVADFGLAKWTESVEGPTHTGQMLGSPPYMSPEQAADAANVSGATDVYSLGATLYALVTGRPPFQAANIVETLDQVRHQEPVAPRLLNPAIDRNLDTITLTCLRKEASRRYATALALANDLSAYSERRPIQARPVQSWERAWMWSRRHPARAAVLLTTGLAFILTAGLVGTLIYLRQREEILDLTTEAATVAKERQEEAQKREKAENRLRLTAEASDRLANRYLNLNRVLLAYNSWKEDNLLRARELLAMCPADSRPWEWHYVDRLCNSASLTLNGKYGYLHRGWFTPDGKHVIAQWHHDRVFPMNIVKYNATTGEDTLRLTFTDELVQDVSQDGRRLVSVRREDNLNNVLVYDLDPRRQVFSRRTSFMPRALSPDGKLLGLVNDVQSFVQVIEVDTGQELLTFKHPYPTFVQSIQFNCVLGQLILEDYEKPATVWDLKTGTRLPVDCNSKYISISLDGNTLVATYQGTMQTYDARTGQRIRLVMPPNNEIAAFWNDSGHIAMSVDGRLVAAISPFARQIVVLEAEKGFQVCQLKGHTDRIWEVAFDPTGRRLASFSRDGTIRIWDLSNRLADLVQVTTLLSPSPTRFCRLAVSLDGQALARTDGTKIALWNLVNNRRVWEFDSQIPDINEIALNETGDLLAIGSALGTLKVWNTQRREEIFSLRNLGDRGERGVSRVALSPHGGVLAAVLMSGNNEEPLAKFWDMGTGKEVHACPGRTVAFNHSAGQVAIGVGTSGIIIREISSWQPVGSLDGPWAEPLCFSPDEKSLAAGPRIWNLRESRLRYTLSSSPVTGMCFSGDGSRVFTGNRGGTITVWDFETGQPGLTLNPFLSLPANMQSHLEVPVVGLNRESRCLIVGSQEGRVLVLDAGEPSRGRKDDSGTAQGHVVADGWPGRAYTESKRPDLHKSQAVESAKALRVFGAHKGAATCVAFSPDGKHALSGGFDKILRFWDVEKGREIHRCEGHTHVVWTVAFSPDGRHALSGSQDQTVRLWEVGTGKQACPTMKGHKGVVCSVAFLPDGTRALSGCWDGTVRFWDLKTGNQVGSAINLGVPAGISLTRDGHHAFFASKDRILRYWDIREKKEVCTFPGPYGSIEGQALTRDERQAILGGADSAIHFYDLEAEKEVKALMGHDAAVLSVAISPDGSRVLSSGEDKTIRLWDIASRRELWRGQCAAKVRSVALSSDGRRAISACWDGSVALWELPR
jgi:WD40 repeat protein